MDDKALYRDIVRRAAAGQQYSSSSQIRLSMQLGHHVSKFKRDVEAEKLRQDARQYLTRIPQLEAELSSRIHRLGLLEARRIKIEREERVLGKSTDALRKVLSRAKLMSQSAMKQPKSCHRERYKELCAQLTEVRPCDTLQKANIRQEMATIEATAIRTDPVPSNARGARSS